MHSTLLWTVATFALLTPSFAADAAADAGYPTKPKYVAKPGYKPYHPAPKPAYHANKPKPHVVYPTYDHDKPACEISKDGQCGADGNGATCIGSGFGNCCRYDISISSRLDNANLLLVPPDSAAQPKQSVVQDAMATTVFATSPRPFSRILPPQWRCLLRRKCLLRWR
jgi:hypothetical protein